MSILESIEKRRTYYALNKGLPVGEEQVVNAIERTTELVPDAFNMRSARVIVVLGKKQDDLWDAVYRAFDGKVAREKIDGFRAAAGSVLYFIDNNVVKALQEQFPLYAENFPTWAQQANGMLQFSVWTALRDLDIGANLQHYNPVIDAAVADLFDVPANWQLIAQMPFGGIAAQPNSKDTEDISKRVRVIR
ncbi:MAG: nitroreductase family protein [Selenomonas montiformis]|nr:nitroreductase family protein [Selenomonas montiformis]